MYSLTFRLTACLYSLLPSVAAFSAPLECSGICVNTHDPSLIQHNDGTYYRFATGGGIPIHTAPSVQGPWSFAGDVLEGGSTIAHPNSGDAWAPDVHLVGDTYYCYYTLSEFGTQNSVIGVATSPSMEPASWTDHGSTGVESSSGDEYNTIDANLFQEDGGYHLNFGSFWGDLYQTPMSSDALTSAGDSSTQLAYNSTSASASEAAYLFKHDSYYYLFWSSGDCCGYDDDIPAPGEEYKIMVCRSDSVKGEYVSNLNDCSRTTD